MSEAKWIDMGESRCRIWLFGLTTLPKLEQIEYGTSDSLGNVAQFGLSGMLGYTKALKDLLHSKQHLKPASDLPTLLPTTHLVQKL